MYTANPFIDAWPGRGVAAAAMVIVRLGPIVPSVLRWRQIVIENREDRAHIGHTMGTLGTHWVHIEHTWAHIGHTWAHMGTH